MNAGSLPVSRVPLLLRLALYLFALGAGALVLANSIGAQTTPAGTTYRGEVLSENPRAYWRLGEASGTTAAD